MEERILSVDLGATKISVTVSTVKGVVFRAYQRTRLQGDERSIPEQIIGMADRALEAVGGSEDSKMIGVSSAGPFIYVDGTIELVSPNICGGLAPDRDLIPNDWDSVPLEKVLAERYPDVVIENDAVSGVVAERTFGEGIGVDDVLYVTWSTGIGTGAFVDGRLIKGKNGNAPHGGHIYLDPKGPVCGCGNRGDLEGVASGASIANQYGSGVSTADVFERYREKDSRAVGIIDRAAFNFGRGLASINAVLDTSLITIGGSVFLNNRELLLPKIREQFNRSFSALSSGVRIMPTGLGEHLGDVAAISLVIPEGWLEDWRENRYWEKMPETLFLH